MESEAIIAIAKAFAIAVGGMMPA
ncbi:MAG: hypothetical protein UW45_C0020G0001, partial [Parcubacteria group bacterium GW2011_GWC2_44_22]